MPPPMTFGLRGFNLLFGALFVQRILLMLKRASRRAATTVTTFDSKETSLDDVKQMLTYFMRCRGLKRLEGELNTIRLQTNSQASQLQQQRGIQSLKEAQVEIERWGYNTRGATAFVVGM